MFHKYLKKNQYIVKLLYKKSHTGNKKKKKHNAEEYNYNLRMINNEGHDSQKQQNLLNRKIL